MGLCLAVQGVTREEILGRGGTERVKKSSRSNAYLGWARETGEDVTPGEVKTKVVCGKMEKLLGEIRCDGRC